MNFIRLILHPIYIMNMLKDLLNATTNQYLTSPYEKLILYIYLLVFIILFLEHAVLLAFFLPGDSLLIILGILISKGVLNFFITLSSVTVAVSLGSWISYLQGKFFKNTKILRLCISYLPKKSYQKAQFMLNKHGLCALFIGRFIMFIRTALPTIAGVSGLDAIRFQLFNWISSFIWVFILIVIGFCLDYAKFSYFI